MPVKGKTQRKNVQKIVNVVCDDTTTEEIGNEVNEMRMCLTHDGDAKNNWQKKKKVRLRCQSFQFFPSSSVRRFVLPKCFSTSSE